MNTLQIPSSLTLLVAPRAASRELVNQHLASTALHSVVRVVDSGNLFDAYELARLIRRRTHELDAALNRVRVARTFTCYQLAAKVDELTAVPLACTFLDLLNSFYDQNLPVAESERVLARVLHGLGRIRASAPILVTAQPPLDAYPERLGLLAMLERAADEVFYYQPEAVSELQMALF